jgi:hypothetical protein
MWAARALLLRRALLIAAPRFVTLDGVFLAYLLEADPDDALLLGIVGHAIDEGLLISGCVSALDQEGVEEGLL